MSATAPVIFIGHGSPMNAIADNAFTKALSNLNKRYPTPKAILCVSAHWETKGTWVTHMAKPKTIHDFGRFPKALFDIQYPAPGSPEVAELVSNTVSDPRIQFDDDKWGLDHGTWAILRHVFPKADIPVLQLSLDMTQGAAFHFELGTKLRKLREHGILIVGSGNIVHNLPQIKWEETATPYDWAIEFDEWSKKKLEARDFAALTNDFLTFQAGKLSVPTNEHYFPLLYILGASDPKDQLRFEHEEIQNGSISMRTVSFL